MTVQPVHDLNNQMFIYKPFFGFCFLFVSIIIGVADEKAE